jgi:hypothetical protein
MKNKSTATILILLVLLLITSLACSLSFPEIARSNRSRSEKPAASEESEDKKSDGKGATTGKEIEISHTSAYLDKFGIWFIHGLLTNTADYAVGLAELEVILPEGNPVDTYFVVPDGLASGEMMPFGIRLPESITNVGDYEISVLRLQRVSKEPVPLKISQSELVSVENGMITITAEVVNNSPMDANLNSMHSALFREDGTLITSVSCQVCPRSVPAGGSMPMQFLFFGHPTDSVIDRSEIYISSDRNPDMNEYKVSLMDPVHTYQDTSGWFHLIGEIKNDSENILDLTLIGAFYSQSGSLQGAASSNPTLRSLNPGESCPYELKFLNQGDAITDWQIQVDPALSRTVDSPSIELTQISSQTTSSEFDWSINGIVVNDSQIQLSSIRVVVGLREKNTGRLVGLAQELFRGDFPPGSSTEFSLTLSPDPSINPSSLEEFFLVRGR